MHPILFSIGSFFIGTYGVMLALGLVTAVAIAVWRARQVDVPSDHVLDIVFWSVIVGFAGGRITYILVDLLSGQGEFLRNPMGMIFSREGFVFLGGLLGGVAMALFLIRRKRLNGWLFADIAMTSLALGHGFGRIGCFLAGCCYGRVADAHGPLSFLAVRFPAISKIGSAVYPGLAYEDQVSQGLLSRSAAHSLPVWPTQLFESAGNFIIFGILMLLWRWRRFNGQIMIAYILLYGILRFSLEFLRGDVERGFLGPLSTSQWICLAGMAFALAVLPYLRRTQNLERQANLGKQARIQGKKQTAQKPIINR